MIYLQDMFYDLSSTGAGVEVMMHAGSLQIRLLGSLIIGASCSLIACGVSAGSSAAAAAPDAVTVSISPSSPTVLTGAALNLNAQVKGASGTSLAWRVDNIPGNSTVGIISGSGTAVVHTAPATSGTHLIKASSPTDANVSGSASVQVNAPAVTVSFSPATASVPPGETLALAATVPGASNTSVARAVDGIVNGNAAVGALSIGANTATYQAPGTAGSHTLTATSASGSSKSAFSAVSVHDACVPAPASALVLDVKAYGAKGDGIADDTSALQAAMNAAGGTGGTVFVPAGTYMVNALVSVKLRSGMTLRMAPTATLKAFPASSSNYAILAASGVSGVNVVGGILQGERSAHTGTGGEWGFGFAIKNSRNIIVEGVTAKECWGDGFYIGLNSKNVTLCAVVADHNRRQGMSITSADSIVIRNSTFKNTAGTAPEFGIDLEPNPGETVSNVLITGCALSNNAGGGVSTGVPGAHTSKPSAFVTGIVIDGNTVTRNGPSIAQPSNTPRGIEVTNCAGTIVANNTVSNNTGYGVLLRNGANNSTITANAITGTIGDGLIQDSCSGNTISNNTVANNTRHGIYSTGSTGTVLSGNTVYGNGLIP